MKKKKNTFILLLVIVLGLVIIFLVYNILNSQKLKKENINYIKTAYNDLTDNINTYNSIRTKYNEKLSSFVLATYENEHNDYINLLTEYNKTIENIDNSITKIKSKCNIIYNDININKICSNYETMYEKLVNIYVTDINMYNENIKKYNEYKNENLKVFEKIHTDYIDYNKDGKYEGRDSNEETKS